jgi:hypothetical protein
MGLNKDGFNLAKTITKFDFSRTSNIAFIHSMQVPHQIPVSHVADRNSGGSHFGSQLKSTGYCGLGTAVRNLGLSTNSPVHINFVVSTTCYLTRILQSVPLLTRTGFISWESYGELHQEHILGCTRYVPIALYGNCICGTMSCTCVLWPYTYIYYSPSYMQLHNPSIKLIWICRS